LLATMRSSASVQKGQGVLMGARGYTGSRVGR
jgi:hypothetical protein